MRCFSPVVINNLNTLFPCALLIVFLTFIPFHPSSFPPFSSLLNLVLLFVLPPPLLSPPHLTSPSTVPIIISSKVSLVVPRDLTRLWAKDCSSLTVIPCYLMRGFFLLFFLLFLIRLSTSLLLPASVSAVRSL